MGNLILRTKQDGDQPAHNGAMYGHKTMSSLTPKYGIKDKWDQNQKNFTMSGDVAQSWTIKADCGKSYEQIVALGKDSGFYPPGRVVIGHYLQVAQNSTAGHAIWLKRIGAQASDGTTWSSNAYSKSGGYGYSSKTASYGSGFINYLTDNDLYVKYILLQFSTSGGSGSRKTEVNIRNFKFHWIEPLPGTALVLPAIRGASKGPDTDIIA